MVMHDVGQAPRLHFFRNRPDEFTARAPLASSLQNFETCLFLIALIRYLHALVACVFSIESGLKAALPQHARESLRDLVGAARTQVAALRLSRWGCHREIPIRSSSSPVRFA
jgi:hypothetical protein